MSMRQNTGYVGFHKLSVFPFQLLTCYFENPETKLQIQQLQPNQTRVKYN